MFDALYCGCATTDVCSPLASDESIRLEKTVVTNMLSAELIARLLKDHSPEMKKARKQVTAKIEPVADDDVVYIPRTKSAKLNYDNDKNFRGSRYRGVSVNGKSWQVFIVINKCK
mmetsp:Transcript_24622/g.28302  ORF Transcript_24622/g.28302 Transcript_24622/m.28302 type:complete len:115 (-) Transcript_24622:33-377(-)